MKKKYQIPESGSRCLRTTLCAGSYAQEKTTKVEETEPESENTGDARVRTNLLDI